MCGTHDGPGSTFLPFVPTDSFTDYTALKAPNSRWMCRFCDAVWDKAFTQTHLKSVMCSEGIFPAASNDHLAYWLQNPPEGEWLFLLGDQKAQHLVWRAPVNTSRDVFKVQAGELTLTIRREWLMRGAQAARDLAAIATELRGPKRGAPLKSPFVALSREIDSLSQGSLRPELVRQAANDSRTRDLIRTINSMTAGELWGLTSVLYASNPHKPEPKTAATDSSTEE